MKLTKTFPLVAACILLLGASTFAQGTKDAVILYNSKPIKVELSEVGKILSFYGLMPGYMADFEIDTPSIKQEPLAEGDIDPFFNDDSKNAEYAVISKERKYIKFDNGFATLSSVDIANLNDIASNLNSGTNSKIVLIATQSAGNNDKLIKNRLNSISTYLKLKGIGSDAILTEIQNVKGVDDTISINYIN